MPNTNDGGPAFPQPVGRDSTPQYGMSLRTWLAGKALQGLATGLPITAINDLAEGIRGGKTQARAALALSDALLAELEKA